MKLSECLRGVEGNIRLFPNCTVNFSDIYSPKYVVIISANIYTINIVVPEGVVSHATDVPEA